MSLANVYELQMLDLINAERAAVGIDPLVINSELNASSEDHSAWMLENDVFSHGGAGGSTSRERIEDAGYELEGRWLTGENIAWVSEAGDDGFSDEVVRLHNNLMNSPEHRANLLNPEFKEIGIGIESGEFVDDGQLLDTVFVTQNFGTTAANDVIIPEPETVAPAPSDEPALAVVDVPATVVDEPTPSTDTAAQNRLTLEDFLSARGFMNPSSLAANDTDDTTSDFNVTNASSTSRVEVDAVASEEDGVSVDVEGEGNFSGGGSAAVDDMAIENAVSGGTVITPTPVEETPVFETAMMSEPETSPTSPFDIAQIMASLEFGFDSLSITNNKTGETMSAPASGNIGQDDFDDTGVGASDSFVFNFGSNPSVQTGSTMSRAVLSATASMEDGPDVQVLEMTGVVSLAGTASVSGEMETITSGDMAMSLEELASCTTAACIEDFLF